MGLLMRLSSCLDFTSIVTIDFLEHIHMANKVDGQGERKNDGKLPLELVPVSAITGMAEVLQAGAKKYAPRNWERGMHWSVCYASMMRHMLKWFNGQDLDEETGLSHLKHVLTNAAFLIQYTETCPHLDDRPNKVVTEHVNRKPILYIDMDETLVDFLSSRHIPKNQKLQVDHPAIRYKGFFAELDPMPGALKAVEDIESMDKFDIYLLSVPVADSPTSYQEKSEWVHKYLPNLANKLVLTQDKTLHKGDFLIDDNLKWQDFDGEFIHFNRGLYPSIAWINIVNYLRKA